MPQMGTRVKSWKARMMGKKSLLIDILEGYSAFAIRGYRYAEAN